MTKSRGKRLPSKPRRTERWINCGNLACAGWVKVPDPPGDPVIVTCDGMFPHTWEHSANTVERARALDQAS